MVGAEEIQPRNPTTSNRAVRISTRSISRARLVSIIQFVKPLRHLGINKRKNEKCDKCKKQKVEILNIFVQESQEKILYK